MVGKIENSQSMISLDVIPSPGSPGFWATLALATVTGGVHTRTAALRSAYTWSVSPGPKLMVEFGGRSAVVGHTMLYGSKAYRVAKFGQFVSNPLMTFNYFREGDYTRAALSYYGPLGTVYLYNYLVDEEKKATRSPYSQERQPTNKTSSKKKKTSTKSSGKSSKQRKSTYRRSKRARTWCYTHRRWDNCS